MTLFAAMGRETIRGGVRSEKATTPPTWRTRATSRAFAFLRDRGLPFLRGADDATLRGLALGMRAAVHRRLAGPLDNAVGGEASFATLGDGDRVVLLPDNRAAFLAKCAAIEASSESIDCALYYLADDATGARFADALLAARARGVRVRLAADTYASIEKQYGPFGYERKDRGAVALLEKLRAAGCEADLLGTGHWCMHRKFLFVDRTTLVLGGRNVANHYAEPGWRDLELLLEGPFAASFAAVVDGTFRAPTVPPTAVPGVLAGVPGGGGAAFARAVTSLVERAEKTLDIEHAYFLSHPWLLALLRAAVARGVRVRAFTNGSTSNDLPFMNWRLAMSARELVAAGVALHRRTGTATLHTKLFVADGRWIVFGSSNLDYYTPVFCAELDLAIESAELGARLTAIFEDGLNEPSTEAVLPGTASLAELEREASLWGVSRFFDLVLHDVQ